MNGGVLAPPNLHRIERPHALKIPARRAEYSLTENVASPFQAEPRHDVLSVPLRNAYFSPRKDGFYKSRGQRNPVHILRDRRGHTIFPFERYFYIGEKVALQAIQHFHTRLRGQEFCQVRRFQTNSGNRKGQRREPRWTPTSPLL